MLARYHSCLALWIVAQTSTLCAADLKLQLDGLKDDRGQFLIAVYQDAGSFLDSKKAVKETIVPVSEAKAGIVVAQLPVGTYAVAVVQDKNSNGKLDTNFLGIPREPFGISQNASAWFGPPSFEQSKFELTEGMQLNIKLREY